jgi:hypothetical protein
MDERDAACADIVPFDGKVAAERARPEDTFGWTLGVNFDVLNGIGAPVGCLHLYSRNGDIFVPMDHGGILVDTCAVNEDNQSPTIANGEAMFKGRGDISCAVDLAAWFNDPALHAYVAQPGQIQMSQSEAVMTYYSFALVASVGFVAVPCDPTASSPTCPLPLIHYQPVGIDLPQPTLDAAAVGSDFTFSADVCGLTPIRWTTSPGWHFLWYDLLAHSSDHALQQIYRWPGALGSARATCMSPQLAEPVDLWVQEATLFIGARPDGSAHFTGILDGILLDPFDSKEPTG